MYDSTRQSAAMTTSTTTEITSSSNHKKTSRANNNITATEVVVPTINRRKLKSLDSSGGGDDDNSNNDARGRGGRMGGLSRADSSGSRKKGMRGMLVKSFSFSLKKSKRSLTPMRRTASHNDKDGDDQGSVSSTEQESSRPMETTTTTTKRVRFHKNAGKSSKKVNKEIITFAKTTEQEAPNYWYTDVDMLDMMEDVKHTVKQYLKKCERYCLAMEKIASKCHQADVSRDSITDMLDPKVLLQIADAAARGVEHHVSPRTVDTRNEVVEMVLDIQDFYNTNSKDGGGKSSYKKNLTASTNQRQQHEEKNQAIAKKYIELSKTSRLIAKTMGDGDALVANQILKRTPSSATTTTATPTTAV